MKTRTREVLRASVCVCAAETTIRGRPEAQVNSLFTCGQAAVTVPPGGNSCAGGWGSKGGKREGGRGERG